MPAALKGLSPIAQMGLIIFAILVIASLIVLALRRLQPAKDFSELAARVWSWWIMAAVFLAIIVASDRLALIFFAFLSFWALKEYITLLKTRPADHRGLALTFLAIPVQYYWIAMDWYGMFIIFIPVYMFLILPMQLV
ncbi:MAG: phosphatidate cytidylyltransferase, partial [bacterium]